MWDNSTSPIDENLKIINDYQLVYLSLTTIFVLFVLSILVDYIEIATNILWLVLKIAIFGI
jgi:cytochrome c oxidase subunit IV